MKIIRLSETINNDKKIPDPPYVHGMTNISLDDWQNYRKIEDEEKENPRITWNEQTEIEKIIDNNCKEIPYEGIEVDKEQMKEDFIAFVKKIIKSRRKILPPNLDFF